MLEFEISASSVLQFERMKKFSSKVLSRAFVHGFIYGNCDTQTALYMANIIEEPFRSSLYSVLPQQILLQRTVALNDGSNFEYRILDGSSKQQFYCVYFHFDDGPSIRQYMLGNLLYEIIDEPCQKLLPSWVKGKSVCAVHAMGGVHGLLFMIHSGESPSYMESRVERFLQIVQVKLENISEMEIDTLKLIMMNKIAQMDNIGVRFDKYWDEIKDRFYNFDRPGAEIRELDDIEKRDLLAFFQVHMAKSAPKRRKLAVFVAPKASVGASSLDFTIEETNPNEIQLTPIKDIVAFKSASYLFPLSTTVTNLAPLGRRSI